MVMRRIMVNSRICYELRRGRLEVGNELSLDDYELLTELCRER